MRIGLFGGCSLGLIWWGGWMFWEGDIKEGIAMVVLSLILILIGIFFGLSIYCTHWIKYGEGKIVIRRVIKIGGYGLLGSWVNDEDEFSVGDIESYGLSMDVLPHSVEYHMSSGGYLATESFFRLKNGQMIGYEINYYLKKDMAAFWDYISAETGLEFLMNERRLAGKRKNLSQQKNEQGEK